MTSETIVRFLRTEVSLFEGFDEERLLELVSGSRVTTFEEHEAVVEFGEEGRFLGILLEGSAEISVVDDAGHKHRVSTIGPGEVFGEMSSMTGERTVADVIGLTRCTALLIPQELFSSMLITHPPALKHLSRLISKRAGKGLANPAYKRSAEMFSTDPYGLRLTSDVPMKLLVIDCGASLLRYTVFDTNQHDRVTQGRIEGIGEDSMRDVLEGPDGEQTLEHPRGTYADAFAVMTDRLAGAHGVVAGRVNIGAVGHRVVHGGEHFSQPVLISDDIVAAIEKLGALAPLHIPANVAGLRQARRLFPDVPHVAVFDTAFHHSMPAYAYLYGVPYEMYERSGLRRFGFHGTSHFYVSLRSAEFLKRPYNELEVVSCHLGNGASVCAIDHGRSVDTSMGLTPVEGLIMGTRCGDLDPGAVVYMMRKEGLSADEIERVLNQESGLKGLSGVSSDMREVEEAALRGEHRALLALKVFTYRLRKYIGAYAAAMGGIDVITFTGGIGEASAGVRTLACQGLRWMGVHLDDRKNRETDGRAGVCDISSDAAAVRVLVVPRGEERMIARETLRAVRREYVSRVVETQANVPIPIEVSAHHVHLCQEDIDALFGEGHQLSPEVELSQPGQYACRERVDLVGPKGTVSRVRVLGPARKQTQVEIAMTEQFKLGLHPPIRESGDLANTPGITLQGPAGSVTLERGVICALRHIHMPPEDALRLGLRDKYMVRIRVDGDRELVFGDVLVRVSPGYRLAMHIDTDEGNAAHITTGMTGHIDQIQSRG